MTFEELLNIAAEQETRIFNLDCSFVYDTLPHFSVDHFKNITKTYIHNACWESLLDLKFPFEQIIPRINFVHSLSSGTVKEKTVTSISLDFSLFILNLPSTSVEDIKLLHTKFLELFDNNMVHTFSIPMEIRSSQFVIAINHNHSLFYLYN